MTPLHTYALIKALYDQSRDYFDALRPLVLSILEPDSFIEVGEIQKRLNEAHGVDVPLHIVKTVCSRAKAQGLCDQESYKSKFRIIQPGQDYLDSLEPVEDVQRRTNAFLSAVVTFYRNKGKELNRHQAQEIIEEFIQDNLEGMIDLINPKESSKEREKILNRKDGALIIEFIKEIQESRPAEYKDFTELVFGSILASLFAAETSSDVTEVAERALFHTTIFLDTNLVFSLLGYHGQENNTATSELYRSLRAANFTLQIFDFTIDEMCRVVNGYLSNKHRYPQKFPVDHIYSVLRKLNWGSSDVSDFIASVEDKVRELGLEIKHTNVILPEYISPNNESLRSSIANIKLNDARGLSTAHDLAAVDQICRLRKHKIRKLEEARAFFLTSDQGLYKVVSSSLGHHEDGTLTEVVLDRVLANILWLKNPKLNLPLSTIIATHSRDLLIDRKVWDSFYAVLNRLRTEGRVTEGQITNLFYHNNVTNLLLEIDRKDVSKINDSLVMEVVELAEKSITEKEKMQLEERDRIQKELSDVQLEQVNTIREYNEQLVKIKLHIKKEAIKSANIIATVISFLTVAFLFFIEVKILLWLYASLTEDYLALLSGPYSGVGLAVLSLTVALGLKIRNLLLEPVTSYVHKRLLKPFD